MPILKTVCANVGFSGTRHRAVCVTAASVIVLAGTIPARSELPSAASIQLPADNVLVISGDGRITKFKVESSGMVTEIMKDAKPLAAGSVLIRHGHQVFVAPDRKMDDGNMLSQKIAQSLGR